MSIKDYLRLWKVFLCFVIPIALIPLAINDNVKVRCAYVLLMMSLYWLFGLAPDAVTGKEKYYMFKNIFKFNQINKLKFENSKIFSNSVTALLPIALFPLLGVISTGKACLPYMKPAVMMMISGLIIAFAIEESKLHKRIALKLLLLIGTGVRKVLLGIMLTTMILSFWISNTATCAMILPVTEAIVNELTSKESRSFSQRKNKHDSHRQNNLKESQKEINNNSSYSITMTNKTESKLTTISIKETTKETIKQLNNQSNDDNTSDIDEEAEKETKTLRLAFFLSIAYASNIGGTGTLTGTGPNLVFQGIMDEYYPNMNDLSFASWMIYATPGAIILVLLTWLFLKYYYLRDFECTTKQSKLLKIYLQKRYKSLGPITFHESAVLFCFFIILMLWFFRSPKFMIGWEELLNSGTKINDATPALLILFIMFITPCSFKQLITNIENNEPINCLINWRNVSKRMPWSIILLVGGGFSLAEGTINSGLSSWFGDK